ncbi:hypothetical protein AFE_3179 [Acidithiobacillus ferrooxidans ATCC 23270]|uniref:Uncharacterized protein n=1 Tax=Acidithiobacillus ferrooxidans (strain ATCC 23270 / DSM 14882 / CIP 104768 / NCIMB 8455) TaxID=243159 RepID=B7JAT1_ACIF2|nr:hypothetical protein AFE_3179 [Acidithiobacillus ferrooxidans ATCC 23270]
MGSIGEHGLVTVRLSSNKSLQRTFDPPAIFAAKKRPTGQAPLNSGDRWTPSAQEEKI